MIAKRERIPEYESPARSLARSAPCVLSRAGTHLCRRDAMGKRIQVKAGDRYGRLTVIKEVEPSRDAGGNLRRRVLCRCDCGRSAVPTLTNLRHGNVSSCGCRQRESRYVASRTHGKRHSRAYKSWDGAKQRCFNPRNRKYPRYGGRGITMCARWRQSFAAFYDDMGDRPDGRGVGVDRIDNNGHYSCGRCGHCVRNNWPANCRWATNALQQRNTSVNIVLTFRGKELCLPGWADKIGMRPGTLWARLKRGWTVEDALTTPTGERRSA